MLNLTPQERAVLVFLGFAALAGLAANLCLKKSCPAGKLLSPVSLEETYPRIDVNKATPQQLEQLPGIGPVLAARIVDYRRENGPFQNLDELNSVKGISPKLLRKMRDRIIIFP